MQRLTIHLKNVDKSLVETKKGMKKKTFNTVVFKVSNQKQIDDKLNTYGKNVTKSYVSNIC